MTKPLSHPTLEELSAFSLGQLSDEDSEAVETHIGGCQPCCETLLGLSSDDTFVALLQEAKQPPSDETLEQLANSASGVTDGKVPSPLVNHPRYAIVAPVGKGGMGDVFKAEHRMMERTVALKVIKHELFSKPEAVHRFHREVKTAAKLCHPNIVTAHDAEQAGDVHFLVMEYVAGVDLARKVKDNGPLPIPVACDYIQQAARGLHHAHEQGMVHRDIKPHNLMLSDDGAVKILDFGLATLATEPIAGDTDGEPTSDSDVARTTPLTMLGALMGTPDFISPEQASAPQTADIRSDIYSLGCTFYYLLTGQPPFTEGTALQRVEAHGKREPEPIENARDDISRELAEVLRRMMAKQPAERFQTPAEVADALAPFIDAHRTLPTEGIKAEAKTAVSRRSWWPPTIVQSLASAAFALILAGIVYVATDRGTLVINSVDDSVEIIIRPAAGNSTEEHESTEQVRIVDTVTGSTVKRLWSGEYLLDLKGDTNEFQLSQGRFVLKRGGEVRVTVTRSGGSDRQVWATEDMIGAWSISRDGRYMPYVDWRESRVQMRDLMTGRNRLIADNVTEDGRKGGRFARCEAPPVISPDAERIVFHWYEHRNDIEERGSRLRVSRVDGTGAYDLYHDKEIYPQPFDWSPEGELILALFSRKDQEQIAVVSAKDGSAQIIKSFESKGNISNLRFLRDGQSIVYDRANLSGPPNHDIYLLDLEQVEEIPLVQHPANDQLVGCAPDGNTIVFSSDRRGSSDLWAIDVRRPGHPTLIKEGVGDISPLGFSADGSLYYLLEGWDDSPDVYVATIDRDSGRMTVPPRKVSRFREGGNTAPDWTSDGRRLAYVHSLRDRPCITVLTLETEEYREFYPELRFIGGKGARWSPNGKSFILYGRHKTDGRGIFQIDAHSGELKLVHGEGETVGQQPEWTPDGTSIVFADVRPAARWEKCFVVIRRKNLETGEETEILANVVSTRPPCFAVSPDGQSVAFVTHDKQAAKLKIVSIQGGEPRLVHEEKANRMGRIEWARAGTHVIIEKPFEEETELWEVSVMDGTTRKLDLSGKGEMHGWLLPRIHPDGHQIAFASDNQEREEQSEVRVMGNLLKPHSDAAGGR